MSFVRTRAAKRETIDSFASKARSAVARASMLTPSSDRGMRWSWPSIVTTTDRSAARCSTDSRTWSAVLPVIDRPATLAPGRPWSAMRSAYPTAPAATRTAASSTTSGTVRFFGMMVTRAV